MRVLTKELPSCYGVRMAIDLDSNDLLKQSFKNVVGHWVYQSQLPPLFQSLIDPLVAEQWKGVNDEVEKELARKRGEPASCRECDLRAPCFLTALFLIGVEDYWC